LTEELRVRISLELAAARNQRIRNPGEKYKIEEHESRFDVNKGGVKVPERIEKIL